MKRIFSLVLLPVLASATPALADWSHSVQGLGITAPGQTGQVDCPAGGSGGTIWGTGTYTSDSSICMAAVHWGWITQAQGGSVTFQTVPGLDAYPGTARNGVTSSTYGPWSLSFQLTGLAASAPPPMMQDVITWSDSLISLSQDAEPGDRVTYTCPPFPGSGGTVWGSDVYTSDSAICMAALHRGAVTPAGGDVTILVLGSQPAFLDSDRNGVATLSYPQWDGSFLFE